MRIQTLARANTAPDGINQSYAEQIADTRIKTYRKYITTNDWDQPQPSYAARIASGDIRRYRDALEF